MKLRLQRNSVRLRLSEAEVEQLVQAGRIEESVSFDEKGGTFLYEIVADANASEIFARFINNRMSVMVPTALVRNWAASGDVALSGARSSVDKGDLSIKIEKDLSRRRPESA